MTMQLPTDCAEAMRQCVRILAKGATPAERRQIAANCETYINDGRFIPGITIDQFPLLFFPDDPQKALALRAAMDEAVQRGELPSNRSAAGPHVFLASEISAWPECPPVPANSPLRYWLPKSMHATSGPSDELPTKGTPKPPLQQRHQELEILRVLREAAFDPTSLPRLVPGRPGAKANARGRLNFTRSVFDKAWERLRSHGDIKESV